MSSGQIQRDPIQRERAFLSLPGIYVLMLCDVVKRQGVDEAQLLSGFGLTRTDLLAADSRVPLNIAGQALERALRLTGDCGLGFRFARGLRVPLHGSLGLVAMASPTIGAALEAGARYIGLRAPFLQLTLTTDQDHGVLHVHSTFADGPLHAFVMEAILMGLVYFAGQLLGWLPDGVEIWMPGEMPAYYPDLRADLPVPVTYGMDGYQLRMPGSMLAERPQLADPEAAELAREQCELEFQQLFGGREGTAERARRLLSEAENPLPSLEVIADRLHMSSRTLKRRLQDEGQTYRQLLEAELRERALQLLADDSLSVSEVAFRLGYNDASNFSRAFKRWLGMTPLDYRRGD